MSSSGLSRRAMAHEPGQRVRALRSTPAYLEANASRYHGKAPGGAGLVRRSQRQTRAVAEYLAALDGGGQARTPTARCRRTISPDRSLYRRGRPRPTSGCSSAMGSIHSITSRHEARDLRGTLRLLRLQPRTPISTPPGPRHCPNRRGPLLSGALTRINSMDHPLTGRQMSRKRHNPCDKMLSWLRDTRTTPQTGGSRKRPEADPGPSIPKRAVLRRRS